MRKEGGGVGVRLRHESSDSRSEMVDILVVAARICAVDLCVYCQRGKEEREKER